MSQAYTVTATASGTAASVTTTSTFRTLTPSQTFPTQIFEGYHQTYGVGMPIMLTFSQPITDKAAVERALQITTSQAGGRRVVLGRQPDAWTSGPATTGRRHHGELHRAPERRARARRACTARTP